MIIEYKNFLESFDNFISMRPDMMIEVIYHDYDSIENYPILAKEIEDNFFIIRYDKKSFVSISNFLEFTRDTNVNVYHIYNEQSYDYKLFASKIKLDLNSDHYVIDDNIIKKITNKQLTNFFKQLS